MSTNVGERISDHLIWEAFLYGLISAISLNIGSLIGVLCLPPARVRAGLMAFGAGALLFALAVELFAHAMEKAHEDGSYAGVWAMEGSAVFGGLLFAGMNRWLLSVGGEAEEASAWPANAVDAPEPTKHLMLHLTRLRFFSVCTPEEVSDMLQASLHAKRFGAGEYVLRRGTRDYAHGAVFLILTGSVRLRLFGKPGFDWERQAPTEPRYPPTRRISFSSGGGVRRFETTAPTPIISLDLGPDQLFGDVSTVAGVPFVETVVVAVEPSHILVLAGGKALRILEVDLRLGGPCLEQPPDPQPRLVPPPEKLLCARVPPDTKPEFTHDIYAGVPGEVAEADGAAGPPEPRVRRADAANDPGAVEPEYLPRSGSVLRLPGTHLGSVQLGDVSGVPGGRELAGPSPPWRLPSITSLKWVTDVTDADKEGEVIVLSARGAEPGAFTVNRSSHKMDQMKVDITPITAFEEPVKREASKISLASSRISSLASASIEEDIVPCKRERSKGSSTRSVPTVCEVWCDDDPLPELDLQGKQRHLQHPAMEKARHAAVMVWLGILIDAVPESLVIGVLVSNHNGSPAATLPFVLGVFFSNLPESMSASGTLKVYGTRMSTVFLMWGVVTLLTALGSAVGAAIFAPGSSDNPVAVIITSSVEGIAAGSMLTMIAQTMMPEAYEHGGDIVGLSCLAGFLCSLSFKILLTAD